MKLIVLIGIVGHQKAQFALEIATALQNSGQHVGIIDNGEHAAIPTNHSVLIHRLTEGFDEQIYNEIQRMACDIILLIAAESTHPQLLMLVLAHLQDRLPDLTIRQMALIDDRTCDCFPQLRLLLEESADIILRAPFDVHRILGDL